MNIGMQHLRFRQQNRSGKARSVVDEMAAPAEEQELDNGLLAVTGGDLPVAGDVGRHQQAHRAPASGLAALMAHAVISDNAIAVEVPHAIECGLSIGREEISRIGRPRQQRVELADIVAEDKRPFPEVTFVRERVGPPGMHPDDGTIRQLVGEEGTDFFADVVPGTDVVAHDDVRSCPQAPRRVPPLIRNSQR